MKMTSGTIKRIFGLLSICIATSAPLCVKAEGALGDAVPEGQNSLIVEKTENIVNDIVKWDDAWNDVLKERLFAAYSCQAGEVEIQDLQIPYKPEFDKIINSISEQVLAENLDFFFAEKYVTSLHYKEGEGDYVTLYTYYKPLLVEQTGNHQYALKTDIYNTYKNAMQTVLNEISPEMTTVEKLLTIYDYLILHCEYDVVNHNAGTIPDESFSAYGALVKHKAVCQGYANSMAELMNYFGIENCVVTSNELRHAWNMVKIDGQWYHLDATWDDPIDDVTGRCYHRHFLKSDAEMVAMGYHDENGNPCWVLDGKEGEVPKATSENAFANLIFRTNPNSAFQYVNGSWYYNINGNLVTSSLEGQEVVSDFSNSVFQTKPVENGDLEIIRYTGNETNVVIPSSIDGKNVVGIGRYAFRFSKQMQKVEIPASVSYIKSFAFQNCANLQEVIIGEGTVSLEEAVFDNCEKLSVVIAPASMKEIRNKAFARCSDKLTFYGDENSYAKQYADKTNISFKKKDLYIVAGYVDISAQAWYLDAVAYAIKNQIMVGKGNGKFDPDSNLTREEFATILYTTEGRPQIDGTDISKIFRDVKPGSWYENSVSWAYSMKITSGYGAKYGVADKITREQLVVMLYAYAKQKGVNVDFDGGKLDAFSDKNQISSWAKEAMSWAVTQNVVIGKGKEVDPKGYATRAECACIIMKLIEKM